MARLRWTPAARTHLDEIFDYIAVERQSPTAATKLLRQISERGRYFASYPLSGHPRTDLEENVRCFLVGAYVVFYRPMHDGIEVLLVTHGARDIPRLFRRLAGNDEEE